MKQIKLLNTARCGNILKSEMNTYFILRNFYTNNVKMSLTRGQSAWLRLSRPSETTRSAFSSGRGFSGRKSFYEWLVGIVDGDGTFYFGTTSKGNWTFSFGVAQSTYNLRLLYFIKSQLKIGKVNISKNMGVYRVRNQKQLLNYVIPIFDNTPLLTSKYFNYMLFKKALLIASNQSLTKKERDKLLFSLKVKQLSNNYVSPAWKIVNNHPKDIKDVKKVMSKAWIIGFTEAEGSFYITKKDKYRLAHGFGITQKLDPIVLESIGLIFDIKVVKKKTHFSIDTTNSKKIKYITDYYFKTMKGRKSLEYRVWARSFNKKRKDFEYMSQMQDKLRKIRYYRPDKSF